jgi:membrane-bound ClpP family serine protease
MSPAVWVATLLAAGLGVIVLEVFIPSGGILGFVSVMALVAAVVMAFTQLGTAAGMAVLAFTVGAVPAVLALAFRWFPDTPLGRRVLPPPPDPADVLPGAPKRQKLRSLIGRSGLAASELVPWGTVHVDGLVIDAMSESGPIAVGAVVDIVGVQGLAAVVRVAAAVAAPPAPSPQPGPPPAETAREGLSPTLETFEFDHLDRPGA